MDYIITAFIGLVSGATGSLIAPWIHWNIEIRKEKRRSKIELLDKIREEILNDNIRSSNFLNSIIYVKIRPFLTKEFVVKIEDHSVIEHNMNEYRSPYQSQFLEEIQRIEKEWGVVLSKNNNHDSKFGKTNSGNSISFSVSKGNKIDL